MTPAASLSRNLERLQALYQEQLPFNRLVGLRIDALLADEVRVAVAMRPELVGNFIQGTLHGGVISTILDVTGGLMASVEVLKRLADRPFKDLTARLATLGTIDLRVDYLRPGRGERFTSRGTVLRTGNKIAVTRMSLRNELNAVIAVGTGTYLVG